MRYFTLICCALCMALLKIFDKSGVISMLLVLFEMSVFLWNIRHAETKKHYLITALAFAAAYIVHIYGYTKSVADFVIGLFVGLMMFATLSAERLFRKNENHPLYCLISPIAFYLLMLISDAIKLNIAFRLDSYFSSLNVLMQIIAVFGVYFIDFMIMLSASVAVFTIDHGFSKKSLAVTAAYLVIIGGLCAYGMTRLNQKEEANKETVRVACTTGPYCGDFLEAVDAEYTLPQVKASMEKTVISAISDNADIIVYSEEAYCLQDYEEEELLNYACALASEYKIHILLPYEIADNDESENGKSLNELCWIDDKGEIIYRYVKHCLIPIVENMDYVKGDKQATAFNVEVDGNEIKVVTVICYDSDFDLYMKQTGSDIDILFIPCWDWQVIAQQHLDIASLTAISLNTTVVRSVYDGWSAVIDKTGSILVKSNSNDIGYEQVMVYDISVTDQ